MRRHSSGKSNTPSWATCDPERYRIDSDWISSLLLCILKTVSAGEKLAGLDFFFNWFARKHLLSHGRLVRECSHNHGHLLEVTRLYMVEHIHVAVASARIILDGI